MNLEKDVYELEEQLSVAQANVHVEQSIDEQMEMNGEVTVDDPLTPLFSSLTNRNGHNARMLLKGRIESILMTDFLN
jgi:hypothetical protein